MMKKIKILSIVLFVFNNTFAQAPQGISYQAAVRNSYGQLLSNRPVQIRFTIVDSIATGNEVYKESSNVTTNSLGLFTLNIGMGAPIIGTFSSIDWGANQKFLKVELDTMASGSNFIDLGTQQMMSVPFALFAGSAGALTSTIPSGPRQTFTMISSEAALNMNFLSALDYCHNLVESGFADWRLPTFEEVADFIEFNGMPSGILSTFTRTLSPGSNTIYVVDLMNPANNLYPSFISVTTYIDHKVQCVR